METDSRDKQRKSYTLMRKTYDLTMAILILGVAIVMLFGEKMQISFIMSIDPLMRYLFGGLCLLYGGFRLYRGLKNEY